MTKVFLLELFQFQPLSDLASASAFASSMTLCLLASAIISRRYFSASAGFLSVKKHYFA